MPKTYLDPATGEEINAPNTPNSMSVSSTSTSTRAMTPTAGTGTAKIYLDPATGEEMHVHGDTHDVRSQIAARAANPPATAHGDPNAKPESTLETIFPAAAHPLAAAGGFLSSINPFPALAHPIDAFNSDMAARDEARKRLMTDGWDSGKGARNAFAYAVPFFGPAMARAGEQMESPDATTRARGFGGAVGLTSGPAAVNRVVAAAPDVLRVSAEKGYGKVFGPDADPSTVRSVVPRLIDERVHTSNPRIDLTRTASARSASADAAIDRAVTDPITPPIDRNAVLSSIENAKQQYLNSVIAPDQPYSSIKRVGGKFAGGKWRQDANPNVVSSVPAGPDAEAAIADLNTQADTVRGNASNGPNGRITPVAARRLQTSNPDASVMNDAIQSQLNRSNPDIAAASSDRAHWDTVNRLAADAPEAGRILPTNIGAKTGALALAAHFIPGGAALEVTLAALPTVYRFMTSPAYRTASALVKARIADLIKANDIAGAAEVIARVGELSPQSQSQSQSQSQGTEPQRDVYLKNRMSNSLSLDGANSGSTYPHHPSPQSEFPLNDGAEMESENHDMFASMNPQQRLPDRFVHARTALRGSPIHPGGTDPDLASDRVQEKDATSRAMLGRWDIASEYEDGNPRVPPAVGRWVGLSGRPFEAKDRVTGHESGANTILLSRQAGSYWPEVMSHEEGHAAWQDITPEERKVWSRLHDDVDFNRPKNSEDPAGEHNTMAQKTVRRYWSDPSHSFAQLFGQYQLNPSEMKAEDPEVYQYFKKLFGGREYTAQTPGNIDLHSRPTVHNPDGSVSTVLSKSFNIDGREVLLPTISDDGQRLTDQQAVDLYRRTGKHLGVFSSPSEATDYAQRLHEQQSREYVKGNGRKKQNNP